MIQPPASKPPALDVGFEFELTDFASAREALDDTSIAVAAEAACSADADYWVKRRRPRLATDRALAGSTIDWLLKLPEGLRPNKLSEQLPRLANQIADAWPDRERCLACLDDLLSDRRGGRRGLPYDVRSEVQSLHAFLAALGS